MNFFFNIRKTNRRRGERGAALLFAIGILAMLMMLGLGFVTNALIANRIASNNSRRSQARTLARAAVAQAMTQIMLYVDQANNPNDITDTDRILYDFSAIRSMGDTVAVNQAAAQTSETNLNDQLTGTGTKLQYTFDTGYNVAGKKYDFSSDAASWVFFYDDAGSGSKRIIGRAAWQVLPRHTRANAAPEVDDDSRLSLFKMLAGAVGAPESDAGAETPPADSRDVLLNECNRIPWRHRWGRGVEEMYLDLTGSPFAGWIANGDNSQSAPPYTFDMLFSAYYNYFSSAPVTNRAWIRKWFCEGDKRLAKEAYVYLDGGQPVYLHRFNLGDKTTEDLAWYERFPTGVVQNLGAGENNVLDDLAASSHVYRERDIIDDKTNYYSGLPFLKRIGNDAWSFDSIENFRKQIAANLNDYCDDDDIPTSDVPAANWSISDSTKFPKYTGNEKTSCINEFAWVFELPIQFVKGTGNFTSYAVLPPVASSEVDAAMFAELVNVYNADPESSAYSLSARLETLSLSFEVSVQYTISIIVKYINSDSSSGTTAPTPTFTLDTPIKYTLTLAKPSSEKPEVVVENEAFSASGGYRIGGVKLSSPSVITSTVEGITHESIQSALNTKCGSVAGGVTLPAGATLDSWEIASLQIALRAEPKGANFEMSPLLLNCTKATETWGVDFANFSTAAVGTITVDTASGDTKWISVNPTSGATSPLRFVLAGFEAIDPRQNLNPKMAADKSDWYLKPTLIAAKVGGDSAAAATEGTAHENLSDIAKYPSMEYAPAQTDISKVFKTGKVNTCSNPSTAQILVSGALSGDTDHADLESATDPAWLGNDAGQHISTAVIRNAPMKSLWELGAIHRARPWQTLNLTGASNFVASGAAGGDITANETAPANFADWTQSTGTDYVKGDGGILDMVKLSNACKSWGKLDFTLLTQTKINADNSAFSGMDALDKALVKALFYKIRQGQTLQDFITTSPSGEATTGTKIDSVEDSVVDSFIHDTGVVSTSLGTGKIPSAKLRSELLNTNYGESGHTCTLAASAVNDASQEEIIGKTIGLLSADGRTIPNVFRILVIAQSIDDIGGFGTDIPVVKKDSSGGEHTVQCQQGVFNYCSATDQSGNSYNLYFDRITGEVKLIATIERDPETGNMKIRQLEYLD